LIFSATTVALFGMICSFYAEPIVMNMGSE